MTATDAALYVALGVEGFLVAHLALGGVRTVRRLRRRAAWRRAAVEELAAFVRARLADGDDLPAAVQANTLQTLVAVCTAPYTLDYTAYDVLFVLAENWRDHQEWHSRWEEAA